MTLTTGTLKLKGTPASGNASIAGEVEGKDFTGTYTLFDAHDEADPSVGTLPTGMRDFSGHTQSWGREYGETISLLNNPQIERNEQGGTYAIGGAESLEFTHDRNETTRCTNGGTLYVTGDNLPATFYRRTKQTSGSWTVDWTQDPYLSEWRGGAARLYDYKWELDFCLMEGERIYVTPNTTEAVENIKVGDYVYTAHQHTGQLGLYKVENASAVSVSIIQRVEFADGSVIHCTGGHKLMTPEGGKSLPNIKDGDPILRYDDWGTQTETHIVKREGHDVVSSIYKIEVEDAHTYIGENGIFHHNVK